jgi:hypothetical protein
LVDGDLEAICDIQRWSAGIDCGDVVRLIAAVEQTDVLER